MYLTTRNAVPPRCGNRMSAREIAEPRTRRCFNPPCHFWQCSSHSLADTVQVVVGMSESMLKKPEGPVLSEAIQLAHQGDREAFALIYRSYSDLVHRICLRMLRDPAEAEDAAQDVFFRVFLKINTFRGDSAFSSWLYRLTTNVALMRLRKNKRSWTPPR